MPANSVALSFDGQTYLLGDGPDASLAHELRAYADGRFPDLVAQVIRTEAAGLHWTDGARELAQVIEDTRAGRRQGAIPIEGKTIETMRVALGPIVDAPGSADSSEENPGAAELLAALKALDCKVCWGLGWTPVFAVTGAGPEEDEWRQCRRCLGTGARSKEGAQRPEPSQAPRRHRAG